MIIISTGERAFIQIEHLLNFYPQISIGIHIFERFDHCWASEAIWNFCLTNGTQSRALPAICFLRRVKRLLTELHLSQSISRDMLLIISLVPEHCLLLSLVYSLWFLWIKTTDERASRRSCYVSTRREHLSNVYPQISILIHIFKQFDHRWGSETIWNFCLKNGTRNRALSARGELNDS